MFEVMLAHPVGKKEIDWTDTIFVQPKLDGVRCYFTKDGAFSRNHKKFYNVAHLEAQLFELFQDYPDLVLDGELYNHDLKEDFNKIISLVRKQKPTFDDRTEASELIQFHCYDLYDPANPDMPFDVRHGFIADLKFKYKPYNLKLVDTFHVENEDDIKLKHKVNLEFGYEGTILRYNWAYEQKRSYSLQKVKDFEDTEAKVIGYVQGKGKRSFGIGKFLCVDSHGIEFGVPVMETNDKLKEMWEEREKYLGSIITFTYFQKTQRGSYRHPLYKCVRSYE